MDNNSKEYFFKSTCRRVVEIEDFIRKKINYYSSTEKSFDPKDRMHYSAIRKIAAGNIAVNIIVHESLARDLNRESEVVVSQDINLFLGVESKYKSLFDRDYRNALH